MIFFFNVALTIALAALLHYGWEFLFSRRKREERKLRQLLTNGEISETDVAGLRAALPDGISTVTIGRMEIILKILSVIIVPGALQLIAVAGLAIFNFKDMQLQALPPGVPAALTEALAPRLNLLPICLTAAAGGLSLFAAIGVWRHRQYSLWILRGNALAGALSGYPGILAGGVILAILQSRSARLCFSSTPARRPYCGYALALLAAGLLPAAVMSSHANLQQPSGSFRDFGSGVGRYLMFSCRESSRWTGGQAETLLTERRNVWIIQLESGVFSALLADELKALLLQEKMADSVLVVPAGHVRQPGEPVPDYFLHLELEADRKRAAGLIREAVFSIHGAPRGFFNADVEYGDGGQFGHDGLNIRTMARSYLLLPTVDQGRGMARGLIREAAPDLRQAFARGEFKVLPRRITDEITPPFTGPLLPDLREIPLRHLYSSNLPGVGSESVYYALVPPHEAGALIEKINRRMKEHPELAGIARQGFLSGRSDIRPVELYVRRKNADDAGRLAPILEREGLLIDYFPQIERQLTPGQFDEILRRPELPERLTAGELLSLSHRETPRRRELLSAAWAKRRELPPSSLVDAFRLADRSGIELSVPPGESPELRRIRLTAPRQYLPLARGRQLIARLESPDGSRRVYVYADESPQRDGRFRCGLYGNAWILSDYLPPDQAIRRQYSAKGFSVALRLHGDEPSLEVAFHKDEAAPRHRGQ